MRPLDDGDCAAVGDVVVLAAVEDVRLAHPEPEGVGALVVRVESPESENDDWVMFGTSHLVYP